MIKTIYCKQITPLFFNNQSVACKTNRLTKQTLAILSNNDSFIRFSSMQNKRKDEDYEQLAKQTKVERLGSSVSHKVIFTLTSRESLNCDDAEIIQEKKGYNPYGYGGPWDFKKIQAKKNLYKYTWSCAASCD